MEFLKEILGEQLFGSVSAKLNEYNGAHADKQIKLADLSSGEYVSKGKFDDITARFNSLNQDFDTLKKSTKSNDEVQSLIKELETKQQTELNKIKHDNAYRFATKDYSDKQRAFISKMIDGDKLVLSSDGESFVNFDDMVKPIKEEYAELFNVGGTVGAGSAPQTNASENGNPKPKNNSGVY